MTIWQIAALIGIPMAVIAAIAFIADAVLASNARRRGESVWWRS